MNDISYDRQSDIFDPVNQKLKIKIMGAGSLGSFIALNLAKLGFKDIEVFDYDIVEEPNIPNQFYRLQDIGKPKLEALKEIIKDFSGIEIKTTEGKVTTDTSLDIGLDTIFILTFDTLENRKILYKLVKDYKCFVLDVRAGGEEYNIRFVDTFDKQHMIDWEKSLNITPTKLPCGARSIIYTNLSIASEVCNLVKKINNDEKKPTRVIRHMSQYLILNNQPKEKKE